MSEDHVRKTWAVKEHASRKNIIFKSRLYEYTMFPYADFIYLFLRYTKNRNIKYKTINYIFEAVDREESDDEIIIYFLVNGYEDMIDIPSNMFASQSTRSACGKTFSLFTWMQLAEQIDIEDSQLMDAIGLSLSTLCVDTQNTILDFIGLPRGMSWVDGFANSVRIVRKCRSQ